MSITPKILEPALRQFQHNDCSGLVFGFDHDKTVRIVSGLEKENKMNICDEKQEYSHPEVKGGDVVQLLSGSKGLYLVGATKRLYNLKDGIVWSHNDTFGKGYEFKKVDACITLLTGE